MDSVKWRFQDDTEKNFYFFYCPLKYFNVQTKKDETFRELQST